MPFIPLFVVIGIFLAISKILQPSQQGQSRRYDRNDRRYDDFEDNSLSLALIDYISRESKNKAYSNYGSKSRSQSGKRRTKEMQRR